MLARKGRGRREAPPPGNVRMPQPDLFDIGPAGMPSGRLELHCAGAECSIHLGGRLFTTFPNDRGMTWRHAAVMLHPRPHCSSTPIGVAFQSPRLALRAYLG